MAELVYQRHPFREPPGADKDMIRVATELSSLLASNCHISVSVEAKQFLSQSLQIDPALRPTAEEVNHRAVGLNRSLSSALTLCPLSISTGLVIGMAILLGNLSERHSARKQGTIASHEVPNSIPVQYFNLK